jgi:hypothetical protein
VSYVEDDYCGMMRCLVSCTTMRGEDTDNSSAVNHSLCAMTCTHPHACLCMCVLHGDGGVGTQYIMSNFNADCVAQQTNWTNDLDFVVGQMVRT